MLIDRTTYYIAGILLAILGLVFIIIPGAIASMFSMLLGIGFLAAGISALVSWGTTYKGSAGVGGMLVTGILSILVAAICFLHPLFFAATIGWLIGILIIVVGIGQLVVVFQMADLAGRVAAIASAVLLILFGVFTFIWPSMLVQLVGAGILFEGISLIIVGFQSKPIDVDPL